MNKLSDYQYNLPDELIAQTPLDNRSDSRLLVLQGQKREHNQIRSLSAFLRPGDRLVFNNTRVIPARLYGQKLTGGKLELMLERVTETGTVLAKIRSSKSPKPGTLIQLYASGSNSAGETLEASVVQRHDDLFELKETGSQSLASFIDKHGDIPLPPYIERAPDADDAERYQTVFAERPGAVAAPTAGLHFDDALLDQLKQSGIDTSLITLHVGAGTFQPVRVDDVSTHVMHAERLDVPQHTVDEIQATKSRGGRIIAVGTTCVRSLEAAAAIGTLKPLQGETDLFIRPGFKFNVVDGILTNFHLPESTLLMLVSAFAGRENTLAAYRDAVDQRYRFFSYGDAMLIWPCADATPFQGDQR